MAKKSPKAAAATIDPADVPVVGSREPCPCGSGKRYKVCHGRSAARAQVGLVRRPFEGLSGECDLVAMREIVPAATGTWTIGGEAAGSHAGRTVTVATLLPMAWPALVRADGTAQVGLQVPGGSGDVSRDIAEVLLRALDAEPGEQLTQDGLPGPGPRLQDLLDTSAPFDVTLHDGFDFWIDGLDVNGDDSEARASLAKASESLVPTERLSSVEAAYWCRIGTREHVRWVLPHDEDTMIDGIARLHVRGEDAFGEGSRYIGAFRAHGLAVPVWDVPSGSTAASLDEPVAAFGARLAEAMAQTTPLTSDERRARAGLVARQVTIR